MKKSYFRSGILLCFTLITSCTSQATGTPANETSRALSEIHSTTSSQPTASAKPFDSSTMIVYQ